MDRPVSATSASTVDDIYTLIGQFGRYQKRIVFIVAFISFSTAFNNLGYAFWAARPDFHCVPDNRLIALVSTSAGNHGNVTVQDELLLNLTVPWENTTTGRHRRSRSLTLYKQRFIFDRAWVKMGVV